MEKDAGRDGQAEVHKLNGCSEYDMGEAIGREARQPSLNERLKDVLNKPRKKLETEEKSKHEREIDTDVDRAVAYPIDLRPVFDGMFRRLQNAGRKHELDLHSGGRQDFVEQRIMLHFNV